MTAALRATRPTGDHARRSIEYAALAPMLIVLRRRGGRRPRRGVRAAAGRATRSSSRSRSSASSAAFVAVVAASPARQGHHGAQGAVAIDGPALFLQGTDPGARVLGGAARSPSASSTRAATRSPRRPSAVPGSPTRRAPSRAGWLQTEVFPLALFAVGGMLLFPAANDLLTMFVALEVLSLPLYLLCGLARRRRLLSQEAALKYFLLGAFSSAFFLFGVALLYGYAGSLDLSDIADARSSRGDAATTLPADRHRAGRGRPAVQGRRGAVPPVDARRLPGRADPGHRLHGRLHQGRRVRRAAAGLLRRARRRRAGTGGR